MFGVILTTIHKSCGITSQKVEGFKTKEAVEAFVKDWEKPFHPERFQYNDCHTEKPYSTHYTIYEIPDKPVVQAPTDGTFVDMRPKDLYRDMYDLHRLVSCLKELIGTDPTMPPAVIADVSQADYLADKILHAIPEPDEEL